METASPPVALSPIAVAALKLKVGQALGISGECSESAASLGSAAARRSWEPSVDDEEACTGFGGRPVGRDVVRDVVGHARSESVRRTALDLGEEDALEYQQDVPP